MIGWGSIAATFASKAAKRVVKQIINGNGSETELRKAQIDLAAIDAQAAIGQRSARPFLQYMAGVVILAYLVMTVAGVIINSVYDDDSLEWGVMYTTGSLLIGWAITYTTGIGGLRSWEKSKDSDTNYSTGETFAGKVRKIGQQREAKPPKPPNITHRTDSISSIQPLRSNIDDFGLDETITQSGHVFGSQSEGILVTSEPDLARVHRRALTLLPPSVDMTLYESLRSFTKQRENIASGVSWTMDSRHLERPLSGAIDHVPLTLNSEGKWKSNWSWEAFEVTTKALKEASEIENVPCTHGIDWKGKKRDGPHTELCREAYPYKQSNIDLA